MSKHPPDARVRSIVQKHLTAMSREIAEELAQPLLERFGMSIDDFVIEVSPAATAPATEPVTDPGSTALIYDARQRQWICPRCRRFADLRRRSVTTHMRFCTATPEVAPPKAKPKRSKKKS